MKSHHDPSTECAGCRQSLTGEAESCPHCDLAVQRDALVPPDGEVRGRASETDTEEHAPSEDAQGSWRYVRSRANQDPLFAFVLAVLAADALLILINGLLLEAILPGLALWGVCRFRRFGFWLAMISSGLGLLGVLWLVLCSSFREPTPALLYGAPFSYAIVVLYLRRSYFR